MNTNKWKKGHLYQCPCGYEYEPEKGDARKGWKPGTPIEALPDEATCPDRLWAKIHFREKRYSVPAVE